MMKAKRCSEEQIIAVLKEAEAGAKAKDLCRKYGVSEPTFYNWKAKYAGMTVFAARRLKELESENAKLKRLLAESELDKSVASVCRCCAIAARVGKGEMCNTDDGSTVDVVPAPASAMTNGRCCSGGAHSFFQGWLVLSAHVRPAR
jgi:putative transposase